MEHWEFLIQKQGDRTWRTLKSPNVEIMEGRYRVVARSNRANLDVEVRVTHSSTLEIPPKQRIQKRSRRTNLEGLMVVIPFTYLNPGIWELQCSGDLMSVLLGISWQYSLYVRVLPILALGEIVEPASSALNSLHLANEDDEAIINEPVSPVWLKSETAEQILKDLIELALPPRSLSAGSQHSELQSSESLLEDETTVEDSLAAIPELPLLLSLQQETYVAHWGETLTINGRVELNSTTNQVLDETSDFERVCAGELRIELCSPHGSEILTQVRQPLRAKLLPLTIKCSFEIPNDWESKVILADIRLFGALAGAEEVRLLAHQSFTITADVSQLLAISTAENKSNPDPVGYSVASTAPEPPIPIKLELFNLVKTTKKTQPLQLNPSPNKILPPQIASRELDETANSLQLPKLPEDKTKTISAAIVVSQPSIQVHDLVKRHAVSLQLPKLPPPTVKTTNATTVVFQPSIQVHNLENHDTAISPVTTRSTTFPYLRRIKPIGKKTAFNWRLESPSGVVEDSTEDQGVEETVRQVLQLPTISLTPLASSQQSRTPIAHDEDAQDVQTQDNLSTAGVIESSFELLINVEKPQLSPLIRKWMRSQGHSLLEPIHVPEQNRDDENNLIPTQETLFEELKEPALVADVVPEVIDVTVETYETMAITLEELQEPARQADVLPEVTDVIIDANNITAITVAKDVIIALTDLEDELLFSSPEESSVTSLSAPTTSYTKKPRTRIAEEIVVYDTCTEMEAGPFKHPFQQQKQPVSEGWKITEPLAIPQLHLPNGELVSGKSIRVFVELPNRRPQVAVKLWVEDCQTRWLLEGPRLLKNLLPNSLGGLEVMTHINVPFGCLEIRLEAIAVDMVTQQESHKVSIHRTVIPPDLPNLPLDELLLRI